MVQADFKLQNIPPMVLILEADTYAYPDAVRCLGQCHFNLCGWWLLAYVSDLKSWNHDRKCPIMKLGECIWGGQFLKEAHHSKIIKCNQIHLLVVLLEGGNASKKYCHKMLSQKVINPHANRIIIFQMLISHTWKHKLGKSVSRKNN